MLPSAIAEGSIDGLTSARCCNYSYYMCSWWWVELPTETCRASSLQKYNKMYIVAFYWTIIDTDSQCIDPWTLNSLQCIFDFFPLSTYRTSVALFLFQIHTAMFCYMSVDTEAWSSWIHALWCNYENIQQDALYRLIYYSKSALHVSGDVFAHHQEHLTVFTVSGSVHPSCCRHQPAATWVNTKYSSRRLHYESTGRRISSVLENQNYIYEGYN